ncbi:hypothetical protein PHMEG_00032054 [Phytophthora megakarya]|uniref:Ndc10 domain-containing protein n=1 Tax=Phytophthora megakarya TaxID=4795 RepID=A0A225UX71_9STRA|nr:hypothetical protein PHMEG_00032054 [Phytophthora megakarya]
MADLGGASESQIRRLGRWNNNQSMEKCYLTSLPREAMRTLAGFEPNRGSFFGSMPCSCKALHRIIRLGNTQVIGQQNFWSINMLRHKLWTRWRTRQNNVSRKPSE